MSTVSTAPACALPGLIHRPGLAAWKVTVAAARTARPRTTPVDAATPLGTSTLTTVAVEALMASIAPAIAPRGSPSKPVPSSASTITAAQLRSPRRPSERVHPVRRRRAAAGPRPAADPGSRARLRRTPAAAPTHSTATCRPASRSRRATTSPSPPLLPFPHTTATGAIRRDPLDRPRHRGSGALHQIERRHPALVHRPAVHRPHRLGVGQRGEPVGQGLHEQRC